MREKIIPYLQFLLNEKLPFLALKKSNENEVKIISQKDQIWHKTAPDNLSYAVFSKFQSNDNQAYIINDSELSFKWNATAHNESLISQTIEENGKQEYLKLFNKAQEQLKSAELKKVVLSRKQEFPKTKSDLDILEDLLNTYPSANCYFFYHPQVGKWMGATPEVLLEVQKDEVQTMSLAGTAVYKEGEQHVWGEKELEEQRLVTDFIISQFEKSGVSDIEQKEIETVKAGHLLHLRTVIKGKGDSVQLESLLSNLHPTPAVCGLPRDESMEFIIDNEGYDRSYYTGYLGVVNGASQSYFVNLRCMQLFDKQVSIYVGGGVTLKSDGELEFNETQEKLKTMYRLL